MDFENMDSKTFLHLQKKLKEYKKDESLTYDFMSNYAYEKLKGLMASGHKHINMRVSGYENIKSIVDHSYMVDNSGFERQKDYIDSPHTKFKSDEEARIVYTFACDGIHDKEDLTEFIKSRCNAIEVIDEVRAQNAPSSYRMENNFNYERLLFVVMNDDDIKKFDEQISYADSQYSLAVNSSRNATYKECAFNVSEVDPLVNAKMFDMPNLVLKLRNLDVKNLDDIGDFLENASPLEEEFINKLISEFDMNKAKENGYKLSSKEIANNLLNDKHYKWNIEEKSMLESFTSMNDNETKAYLIQLGEEGFLSTMIAEYGFTDKVFGALLENDYFDLEDEKMNDFVEKYKEESSKLDNKSGFDDDCM